MLPEAFTPIRSVVSLTKGPSLERASACLARRPVVLSGCGPYHVDWAGAVVRQDGGKIGAGSGARKRRITQIRHADSGACSKLLRQAAQAVGEAPGRRVVPNGDGEHCAFATVQKAAGADLRLTLPAPTNIPPLQVRQSHFSQARGGPRPRVSGERQDARTPRVEGQPVGRPPLARQACDLVGRTALG
ncbi:hypothetical protein GCM10023324_29430 [Streptomyces youssoufiensis]